jgi:iron complex transport system ATP-binding protein
LSEALEAGGLGFSIGGRQILRGIALQARGGEFLGLLGVNGAGKSTLLDLLAGLRKPESGEIRIGGRLLASVSPRERGRLICHLPQGVRGDLPFTVEQVALMGRYPHADAWMESPDDLRAVEEALARAVELRQRRFGSLSGGERQRVLLAACLAQKAEILLMDEPSTYLDLHHQLHCFELLQSEARRGAICIAVTHDLNLALAHCTRIVVLHQAAIESDMTVEQAWRNAAWLAGFSSRLRVEASAEGGRWVAYR